MKIAIIDTNTDVATPIEARAFLPKLVKGLTGRGSEIHLFTKDASGGGEPDDPHLHRNLWKADDAARDAAQRLNELAADVYLIWNGDALAWALLPLLNAATATIAVGHADAEHFYAPARHYRSFLTRVVGATPETSVGFVINCVIEKERVEWIAYDEGEDPANVVETFETCFEKAVADALAAPREISEEFPPLELRRPARESWFEKLKAKLTG